MVYPGYGPVRALFVRFIDKDGDSHELYLLTSLSKKRASARAVLKMYLRRWNIEVGHRQTKETFNLRGYHGHTLHGHINFYALVLLAHQIAGAITHLWSVEKNEPNVKIATVALRARLALIHHAATSEGTCSACGQSTIAKGAAPQTPTGTRFPSVTPAQNTTESTFR